MNTATNSVVARKGNDMLMQTPFEDTERISNVCFAEWGLSTNYRVYFQEMLQNYKRVAGYIYSAADLAKLNLEERPKFVYNLLLPIILQLSGNFINNQSRVEAIPRTPGDFKMSLIMTDMLDYVHYTANDLMREMAMAFTCAIIGRVGWVAQDWSYTRDPEGMLDIVSWDPFRVMNELGFTRRNMKDCNFIVNRGWYSPEEIKNMYAMNDDDLWEEIDEKAKLYLGTSTQRNNKLVTYIERTFGPYLNAYKGDEQGYDEVTVLLDGMLYNNGNYFDGGAGLFKVIEFHERRQEKIWTIYDPYTGRKFDITSAIDASKDGKKYDQEKLTIIKEKLLQRGIEPVVNREIINQIFQTAVCPAFNLKLYEAPYAVQNGNFKLTPIFCFDFGMDSMDWKSYVDHMIDPVSSFNLEMNTLQTYLMKTSHGNLWAEEGAFGEHEDSILENKIGDIKYVKAGYWEKWKKDVPPTLPVGLLQMSQLKKELVKEVTGVRDNALGTRESSGESGKVFNARVQQSDVLQTHIQDGTISQMKMIGENTKDNLIHYLEPGRVIRITQDETNPYWLEIYGDAIKKLFLDKETGELRDDQTEYISGNFKAGKYDIMISKAPFGEQAKEREFAEMSVLTEVAVKIGRPDLVNFQYLVEQSRLRKKEEWIQFIKMVDQNKTELTQQAMAAQGQQNKINAVQANLEMKDKALELSEKHKQVQTEELMRDSVRMALSE